MAALLAHGNGEEHYRWLTEIIERQSLSSYTTWLYSDNACENTKNEMEWKRTELNEVGRHFYGTETATFIDWYCIPRA